MLSERDTISPNNRYRWGACNSNGTQLWSRIYADFDECYEDYVEAMGRAAPRGLDLSKCQWRGVFNLEQAARLMNDENIYTDRLDAPEDAD